MTQKKHCGYVGIVGRPNVGKSTLLNRLIGKKISITSSKPQTTQHQIIGIKTVENTQAIYVDTPGMLDSSKKALNRLIFRAAKAAVYDVDVIVFMIDVRKWTDEDAKVLKQIKDADVPVILALNKVDLVKDKRKLLPTLKELSEKFLFKDIVPISAQDDINLSELERVVFSCLPPQEFLFPEDQLTDQNDQFIITEVIREKIMRVTGQEVPYGVKVIIESSEMKSHVLHLNVVIWVERKGQKVILIGKKGDKLKEIGTKARQELEEKFGKKIFLTLWVKVKEGWSDDEAGLKSVGFGL